MNGFFAINREVVEKHKRRRRKPKFRWEDVLAELRSKPTCSIPLAGQALGDLSPNASYEAAAAGLLGVPIMEIGGKKKRVPSIAVLKKLGLVVDQLIDPPAE
jgi:hypothetical protein